MAAMDIKELKVNLRASFEAGSNYYRQAEEAFLKSRAPDSGPLTAQEVAARRQILKTAELLRTLAADVERLDDDIAEDYLGLLNALSVPEASFHDGTFANALVHLNKTLPGHSRPWRPRTVNEFISFLTRHATIAKAN
jgi:hypothetical protein